MEKTTTHPTENQTTHTLRKRDNYPSEQDVLQHCCHQVRELGWSTQKLLTTAPSPARFAEPSGPSSIPVLTWDQESAY